MFLRKIRAENYRVFGDGVTGPILDWELLPGLNILVGENDAGKSCVIEAIRQVLWTTSYEHIRLGEHDFHVSGRGRATELCIEATLAGLSPEQEAAVLDWLTHEKDGTTSLTINLQARWHPPHGRRRGWVETVTRCGPRGLGPEMAGAVRELVRSTYLRPLRDAEAELRPGRSSRLSQILSAHQSISGQEENDFRLDDPRAIPANLVGLMAFAQHHIGQHDVIQAVQDDINTSYLSKFSFRGDELASRIRVAPELSLGGILERFELSLTPRSGISPEEKCARGLGYNNALFMATELVLLRDGEELALLLIEEPEAHLHPQLQARVMQVLESHASNDEQGRRAVQVVMSTHSPSLAAGADVACMTLVHRGRTFSLSPGKTRLEQHDYEYLRRFIDATKANLFFARAVAFVEGPSEALMLPALAEACGRPFAEFGVSVVNVGDVGLYHYARILQQLGGEELPVPAACITDRDVVPEAASDYVHRSASRRRFESDYDFEGKRLHIERKAARAQGGSTIVCVSDYWTFEYDLARSGCAKLMFFAVQLARRAKAKGGSLAKEDEEEAKAKIQADWLELEAAGHTRDRLAAVIYRPLYQKEASKAVCAQHAVALLRSGLYGKGDELFEALPAYLRVALSHLTSTPVEKPLEGLAP